MKRVPDVDNYENSRLVPLQNVITAEQAKWIIEQSVPLQKSPGSVVAYSRNTRSWGWIYERIHKVVVEQNKKIWKYAIPDDYKSVILVDGR